MGYYSHIEYRISHIELLYQVIHSQHTLIIIKLSTGRQVPHNKITKIHY